MNFEFRLLAGAILIVVFLQQLHADEPSEGSPSDLSNDILAIQGDVVLTQEEIDAAFSKISPEHRLPYIRNGERVNRLVGDLLRIKVVAAEAIAAEFDQDPLIKSRMSMAALTSPPAQAGSA